MKHELRSSCPITCTLDMIGDRWTLILLRDMLNGKKRFSEFLDSTERITTNVLTDRLRQMESSGLVKKTPYQLRPKRFDYLLTNKGLALLPVLQEICRWGNHFIPDTWIPPQEFMERKAGAGMANRGY